MEFKKWPSGGLEKSLKDLGVSSLSQAISKVRTLAKDKGPQAVTDKGTVSESDYEAMKRVISEISEALDGIDLDRIDLSTRERIALMPLRDINEVNLWKEAWLKVILKDKW